MTRNATEVCGRIDTIGSGSSLTARTTFPRGDLGRRLGQVPTSSIRITLPGLLPDGNHTIAIDRRLSLTGL